MILAVASCLACFLIGIVSCQQCSSDNPTALMCHPHSVSGPNVTLDISMAARTGAEICTCYIKTDVSSMSFTFDSFPNASECDSSLRIDLGQTIIQTRCYYFNAGPHTVNRDYATVEFTQSNPRGNDSSYCLTFFTETIGAIVNITCSAPRYPSSTAAPTTTAPQRFTNTTHSTTSTVEQTGSKTMTTTQTLLSQSTISNQSIPTTPSPTNASTTFVDSQSSSQPPTTSSLLQSTSTTSTPGINTTSTLVSSQSTKFTLFTPTTSSTEVPPSSTQSQSTPGTQSSTTENHLTSITDTTSTNGSSLTKESEQTTSAMMTVRSTTTSPQLNISSTTEVNKSNSTSTPSTTITMATSIINETTSTTLLPVSTFSPDSTTNNNISTHIFTTNTLHTSTSLNMSSTTMSQKTNHSLSSTSTTSNDTKTQPFTTTKSIPNNASTFSRTPSYNSTTTEPPKANITTTTDADLGNFTTTDWIYTTDTVDNTTLDRNTTSEENSTVNTTSRTTSRNWDWDLPDPEDFSVKNNNNIVIVVVPIIAIVLLILLAGVTFVICKRSRKAARQTKIPKDEEKATVDKKTDITKSFIIADTNLMSTKPQNGKSSSLNSSKLDDDYQQVHIGNGFDQNGTEIKSKTDRERYQQESHTKNKHTDAKKINEHDEHSQQQSVSSELSVPSSMNATVPKVYEPTEREKSLMQSLELSTIVVETDPDDPNRYFKRSDPVDWYRIIMKGKSPKEDRERQRKDRKDKEHDMDKKRKHKHKEPKKTHDNTKSKISENDDDVRSTHLKNQRRTHSDDLVTKKQSVKNEEIATFSIQPRLVVSRPAAKHVSEKETLASTNIAHVQPTVNESRSKEINDDNSKIILEQEQKNAATVQPRLVVSKSVESSSKAPQTKLLFSQPVSERIESNQNKPSMQSPPQRSPSFGSKVSQANPSPAEVPKAVAKRPENVPPLDLTSTGDEVERDDDGFEGFVLVA